MYCTGGGYTKSTVHQEKLFCYFLLKSIEREYIAFFMICLLQKKRLSHKLSFDPNIAKNTSLHISGISKHTVFTFTEQKI